MIARALWMVMLCAGCSSAPDACFDWTAGGRASDQLQAMGFQGGGPSFSAVLVARLETSAPEHLAALELDDEGDALRVCSADAAALDAARAAMRDLEGDGAVLRSAADRAVHAGTME